MNDVGVIQGSRGAGFPLKPRTTIGGVGNLGAKELEGHSPLEPCVLGDVDFAHAAAPARLPDDVVAEPPADQRLALNH